MCYNLESSKTAKAQESQSQSRKKKCNSWKASAFDTGAIRVSIEESYAEGLIAKEKFEDFMQKVANACDAAMPRKGKVNPHTPVHWWSDKIAQLRTEGHNRMLSQRAKGKPTFP